MDRKQFLKTCGLGCLASASIITLLDSCGTAAAVSKEIKGDDILVPVADFEISKNGEKQYKKYVVIRNEILKYPICVYRFDAENYTALHMECTHQGSELQVFGDKLQCASHGSEFNNHGLVESGPAYLNLRKFPVTIADNILKISLKK